MSDQPSAVDALAPSPLKGWVDSDLPGGHSVQMSDARHQLTSWYEVTLYDLVRNMAEIPRDKFTNPAHVLGCVSLWAFCWTAGTLCQTNPTSPEGRQWARTPWRDYNVALGRLAEREGVEKLETRARDIAIGLHHGSRTPQSVLRLDRLLVALGGSASDMRIEVPPPEEPEVIERWTNPEEALYDVLLKAARSGHQRPTYKDLEHELGMGPNTISAAMKGLRKRGMYGDTDDGGWFVTMPDGSRLGR